jgi:hypothetical protein
MQSEAETPQKLSDEELKAAAAPERFWAKLQRLFNALRESDFTLAAAEEMAHRARKAREANREAIDELLAELTKK